MFVWIRVQDQLPPKELPVLVSDIKYPHIDFIRIGFYDPSVGTPSGWRSEGYSNISVSHWMPLPESPKDDN